MSMRYLRIIVIAVVLVFTSACIDNLECPTPNISNSDEITVIGRITRFDDYSLETRGVKQPEETIIKSYAMAIFHVVNDMAAECVYYENNSSSPQLLFNIDRKDINHEPGDKYAIYVFANMPGMDQFSTDNSLEEMLEASCDVTELDIPDDGFPMVGTLGDYFSSNIDRDNKVFVMTPKYEAGTEMPAPKVDGVDMTTLNVPMKALFAKMNFQIEVRPDQMIEGSTYTPQLLLKSYKVVNVPSSIDFSTDTNPVSNQNDVLTEQVVKNLNLVASGARTIDFTFYLPENLQEPVHSADTYDYPFIIEDEDGNKVLRPEDEKYRQRYKGFLLGDNQPATHIVFVGEFRDHQNHVVDIEYTIHLGKDNYSDFNVVRNGEYNNYITIRGALNSSSNANPDPNVNDYISVDHRVNITHREPTIISLRREVLLDSHYEVRPLRIKYNNNFDPEVPEALRAQIPSHVKVEVLNSNTTNWMRLERSAGKGSAYEGKSIYITENGSSQGKRKFFTTDLVSGNANQTTYALGNSTSVVVPIPSNAATSECVWIYVDEVDPSKDQDKVNYSNTIGDGTRSGTIKVTYGKEVNGTFTETPLTEYYPSTEYVINQRKLFSVTKGSRTYHIEYHEEYLHNFDSDDSFGQTQYEGMQWGAENVQFSGKYPAVYVDLTGGLMSWLDRIGIELSGVTNNIIAGVRPYYDFYLTRDKDALGLTVDTNLNDNNWTGVVVRDYSGYTFSNELMAKLTSLGKISDGTLSSTPKSAAEYCYNKNKRNEKGEVTNVEWYLPAIDEIEEIVTSTYVSEGASYNTYARFQEFQQKFYWSSQPAYIYNNLNLSIWYYIPLGDAKGKLFIDNVGDSEYGDPGSARATSVAYVNGEYKAVTSGLSGAAYNINYTQDRGTLSAPSYVAISPTPTPDAGYKPRTDMARVRCVRKKPTPSK